MNSANNNPCGLSAALLIAYRAVISLGYTHKQLSDSFLGVNHNTLLRIKNGKPGKEITNLFYLEIFLKVIDRAYLQRIRCAKVREATELLRVMREILIAEHGG